MIEALDAGDPAVVLECLSIQRRAEERHVLAVFDRSRKDSRQHQLLAGAGRLDLEHHARKRVVRSPTGGRQKALDRVVDAIQPRASHRRAKHDGCDDSLVYLPHELRFQYGRIDPPIIP